LIDDQGEVAIIFEDDGEGGCKVQSFGLPTDGKFSEYIKHENKNITDKAAKDVLVNYLGKYYSEQNQNSGVASTAESMMNVIYDHDGKA